MPNIVFLDRATLGNTVTLPTQIHGLTINYYDNTPAELLVSRCQQAKVIISNKVVIDKQVLEQLPNLKLIAIAATGINIIDLEACKQKKISVCNITNYATESVPEHCFALILALSKQLKGYQQALEQHRWQQSQQFCFFLIPIQGLANKTLGLIGTGNIAQATASIAKAFNMRIMFHSPSGRPSVNGQDCIPLEFLLQHSDIISLHCPLNKQTQHIINADNIHLLSDHALIINTARGGVIDEAVVLTALKNKSIAGVALDVLETEPPSLQHLAMQMLGQSNLLITPHTAWASQQAINTLCQQLFNKIDCFMQQQPFDDLTL